jgi:hypothetical protein
MWQVCDLLNHKPAKGLIEANTCSASLLIAMQKVVGSNPISRFASNPALGPVGPRTENQAAPHIASIRGD